MKNLLKKGFAFLLLCFPIISHNSFSAKVYNQDNIIKTKYISCDQSYSEVRKANFGNNMENIIKIKYYPEMIKIKNEDGSCLYSRYISISETLYINKAKTVPKKLLEHSIRATFVYDKNSFVGIENSNEDIECRSKRLDKSSQRWRTAQTYEVLYGDKECIVSEMFTIFKQNKFTDRIQYVENSHVDVICTPQGEISVNSKSV